MNTALNVLHVHPVDVSGGGAKMVFQINDRLNEYADTTSKLLVGQKESTSDTVIELNRPFVEEAATQVLERYLSLDGLGSPSSFRLRRILRKHDIDVLHLHNIHGRYFNMLNIPLVPESVEIVWTFHDMWPITGNCAYSYGCERFRESCGSCPHLDEYPTIKLDTTSVLLGIKRRLFNRDITVTVPSQWMYEHVEHSHLDQPDLRHVPNGIDTDHFVPHDTDQARANYDIPEGDRVVLFVASSIDNPQKDIGTLLKALERLPRKDTTTLLTIGGGDLPRERLADEFTVRAPGYIPEDELPMAYSAADVCVVPSRAESFGLVATEAMACETPVVVSSVAGLKEQVSSEYGWLAEPGDPSSFAETISQALQDTDSDYKGHLAREHVLQNYRLSDCVKEYHRIYHEIS